MTQCQAIPTSGIQIKFRGKVWIWDRGRGDDPCPAVAIDLLTLFCPDGHAWTVALCREHGEMIMHEKVPHPCELCRAPLSVMLRDSLSAGTEEGN